MLADRRVVEGDERVSLALSRPDLAAECSNAGSKSYLAAIGDPSKAALASKSSPQLVEGVNAAIGRLTSMAEQLGKSDSAASRIRDISAAQRDSAIPSLICSIWIWLIASDDFKEWQLNQYDICSVLDAIATARKNDDAFLEQSLTEAASTICS